MTIFRRKPEDPIQNLVRQLCETPPNEVREDLAGVNARDLVQLSRGLADAYRQEQRSVRRHARGPPVAGVLSAVAGGALLVTDVAGVIPSGLVQTAVASVGAAFLVGSFPFLPPAPTPPNDLARLAELRDMVEEAQQANGPADGT